MGDALDASTVAADGAAGLAGEKAPIRGRRIFKVGVAFGSVAVDEGWPFVVGGVTGLCPRAVVATPLAFFLDMTFGAGGGRSSLNTLTEGASGSGLIAICGDIRRRGGWRVRRGLDTAEVGRETSMTSASVAPLSADTGALSAGAGGLAALRRASGRFPEEMVMSMNSKSMSMGVSSSPERPDLLFDLDRDVAIREGGARLGREGPPWSNSGLCRLSGSAWRECRKSVF